MIISLYSIIMAILAGSILVGITCLLCHRKPLLFRAGSLPIKLLSIMSALRLLLPVELSIAIEIPATMIYNPINNFLLEQRIEQLNFAHILLTVWLTVAAMILFKFLIKNWKLYRIVNQYPPANIPFLEEALSTIPLKKRKNIKVIEHLAVETPKTIGLFRCTILLPIREIDRQELRLILAHEYQHFLNKDIWIQLLLNVVIKIYWWFPPVKHLLHCYELVSEISCDKFVIQGMVLSDKRQYGYTLVKFAPHSKSEKNLSTTFAMSKSSVILRFEVLLYGKSPQWRTSCLSVALIMLIMAATYFIVLQPLYQPKREDYSAMPVNAEEWYLDSEVNSTIILENGEPFAFSNKQLEYIQSHN